MSVLYVEISFLSINLTLTMTSFFFFVGVIAISGGDLSCWICFKRRRLCKTLGGVN